MRSYATDSPQAVARIVALALHAAARCWRVFIDRLDLLRVLDTAHA